MKNELIKICQQLVEEGKKPSIALMKSRYTGSVPMQEAISALQQWKLNPEVTLPRTEDTPPSPALSLENRVEQLERQVKILQQALAANNRG